MRERKVAAGLPPVGDVDLRPRQDPVRRLHARGPGDGYALTAEREHGARVVRDTAVPVALVGAGDPSREHRTAPERDGRVRRVGRAEATVTETRPGPDDAGADRAHDRLVALAGRPRQRRGDTDALDLAAEARARRKGDS